MSDAEYLKIAISSPNIVMLQLLLDQNKIIDFSLLENALDNILISKNILAYQKWHEYNNTDSISLKKTLRDLFYNEKKIKTSKFLLKKLAEEVTTYEESAELLSIIKATKVGYLFFKDPTTKAAGKNLFSHFFRSDEEIVEYIIGIRGEFEGLVYKDEFEAKPAYIVELASDASNVLKTIADTWEPTLKEGLSAWQGRYEFFLKAGYLDTNEFTLKAIETLFNWNDPNLFEAPKEYYIEAVYINDNGQVTGDLLNKLHEIIMETGVHLNITTAFNANTLFFQSSNSIRHGRVNKLIELFASKKGEHSLIEEAAEKMDVQIGLNAMAIDSSTKINAKEFVEQCHIMHQYKAPEEWEKLSFHITEDRVVVSSENVVSSFVIDAVGGVLVHSECHC